MRRLKTLRVRFALWTAGLLLTALTTLGLFVYLRMAQSLVDAVDNALRNAASQVVAELVVEGDDLVAVDDFVGDLSNSPLLEQGFSFSVLNKSGQLIHGFGPYQKLPKFDLAAFSPEDDAFTTFTDAATGHSVRVYSSLVTARGQVVGMFQVAQHMNIAEQTLNQLLISLLVSVPLVVAIAGVGGYLLAGRVLAPIDQITRTAHHISTNGDLSARLNLATTDDEVGRLANTFDTMLARLDHAFQRERRFTADASHELRTPLTTMRTILGTMLSQKRSTAEYEEALADLAEETDRMRDLTQGLLSLARNDDVSTPRKDETVDLSKLLHDISEPFEELAQEKGLRLTRYIPDNLTLSGDGDALVGLFSNLLANAVKYTPQGKVNLSARSLDKGIEVTVADTGIGIAPDDTPHIFERFYRVDKSRSTPGTGLGLAIAHDAAMAHRGTLSVESEPGRGTTFNVWLPFP